MAEERRLPEFEDEVLAPVTFREAVLLSLKSIESSLCTNTEDHVVIKEDLKALKAATIKLPEIEKGLNNHLHSHDTFKRHVMYPIIVSIILAALGVFAKVVLHVF